ncbi:MAG: hypothetical protein BKP49_08975 [Treponema sp. CETP13]|nr:MAG: hypothetical protein BKP49_08975 [Treponema sp. CETP13]
MKINRILIIVLLNVLLFFNIFTACNKNTDKNLSIDLSSSSNLAISKKWVVINTAYAAFRSSYSENARIEAPGRLGDVYCIEGHHITKDNENWYLFDKGWLSSSSIIIFDNKLQAEYAAKNLKNK